MLACRPVSSRPPHRDSAPWSGHAWTIAPSLWFDRRPRKAPSGESFSAVVQDPSAGAITLRGVLRHETGPRADACVIIVHGLGGSYERPYCIAAALAAERAGMSSLRLALRGADRSGEDFYHAGLTADLEAATSSKALAGFQRLYVLGYSLGGHVSLRYASMPAIDPRVCGVAAVCAPLDLALSAQHIDAPKTYLYRRHVLAGLHEIYCAVAARKPVPTPPALALRAQSLRTWDNLTIAPRFGFADAADYYSQMSVGPRLSRLQVPSLLVQSTHDPMVPPWTYEPHLGAPLPRLEVRRLACGGHVAFPDRRWESGKPRAPLEDAILGWFAGL